MTSDAVFSARPTPPTRNDTDQAAWRSSHLTLRSVPRGRPQPKEWHQSEERGLFNLIRVFIAYAMLGMSNWLAPINLAAKGDWGIGIPFLSLSLVDFVEYRFEDRSAGRPATAPGRRQER